MGLNDSGIAGFPSAKAPGYFRSSATGAVTLQFPIAILNLPFSILASALGAG